jgi:ATP-binding cassette subfamily B protein
MQLSSYLAGGLPGLILACSAAAVFWLGGSEVIAGRMSLGTFVAFMAYQARLLPPLQGLMGLYAGLATARVSLGRVQELLDTPVEVVERPDAEALAEIRGDVAFEDVTLTFDRGAPVLEGASFAVRSGEIVALVGPSGSGKSTIGDLLLRLLDPDAGRVTLDGHDLRGLRLSDVRRHVALVEQEPFLFHATIAENIRYSRPDAATAAVEAAAAQAGIHAFVETLPDKYQTVVGERGRALSAGERQRVAIARAFLADPAVLVLDEPTAALDPLAERQVVAGYEALMKGRTTIRISHRFLLASRADRVIVLEGARVVEDGPPRELLRRGERFARLFAEARPAEGGLA